MLTRISAFYSLLLFITMLSMSAPVFAHGGDDHTHYTREQIAWQKIHQGALLIDVRTQAEFEEGHLDNALHIPYKNIVIGKPVITYLPSNRKYMKNFPNKLGFRVNSLKQLSNKVNLLLKNFKLKKNNLKDKKIPKLISQKINFDNKELASEKFIREWERLYKNNFHLPTNWKKLYLLLKITSIKNKFKTKKKNWKFPPLDKNDINEKVEKIKHVLKIKQKVDCEIISERAILIKKNNI